MNYLKRETAHFNYCFPKNCRAVRFCNKWNNIPKGYPNFIDDLKGTHHCEYKEAYINYLSSDRWLNIRRIVLMKSKFMCDKCQEKENLQVHHLNYNNVFDERITDLITLCKKCHSEQHNK